MTKNLDIEGLKSIVDSYDIFYIDLWGVVHDGISLNKDAINVLNELQKNNVIDLKLFYKRLDANSNCEKKKIKYVALVKLIS